MQNRGKPRILVVGATGFVGKAVIKTLSSKFDFWAISASRKCLYIAPQQFVRLDLRNTGDYDILQTLLPQEPFDAVLYLAGIGPRLVGHQLVPMLQVNATGVEHLLNNLPLPPRRVAYFSTVYVYGKVVDGHLIREDSCVSPNGYYALSKYIGERLLSIWASQMNIPMSVFRAEWIYGSGDPSRKAIPAFCSAVLSGQVPTIYGSGNEIRQPIHISDVVASVDAWLSAKSTKELEEVLLLVGPERIRMIDLAYLILDVVHLRGDPDVIPPEKNELALQYRFDPCRTEKRLNWKPSVTLRQGIDDVISVMQQRG